MKHLAILTSLIAVPSFAADFSAWEYKQLVPVTTTGLTSVNLPTTTLNVARPALEDLRIISPAGIEMPFVIDWPEIKPVRFVDPARFDQSLVDGLTKLTITTGTTEPVRAIHLRPVAAKFIKGVDVETSSDGTNWHVIVSGAVIFREPNDVESVVIHIPALSYSHLRVVIDDKLSPPVAFSGAQLELGASTPGETSLPLTLRKREELKGTTRLTLELGSKSVFIASLRLVTSNPVFSRHASVILPSDGSPNIKSQSIASTILFRISVDHLTNWTLDVPVHRAIVGGKLVLDIDNGDSPPLKIEGINATQHPVRVLFHAAEKGEWLLLSGNPTATAPRYDIASIRERLTVASAKPATAEALTVNRQFKKPTALPDVEAKGISIDLARCRFRKPVAILAPGVIEVDLDTEVLAHSATSFRDLRLVQDGRQIPFITDYQSGPWVRFVEAQATLTPDPKRSRVTIWTVTMALDSLPANNLTCRSPTSLFDRQIIARASMKDSFGNDTRLHLGNAHWTRKPGDASTEFALRLNQYRVPGTFTLETDNGDNPPIEITDLRVHHPTVKLIAKVTESSPAFLYYGNEGATQPQYDLQLVRAELVSAPKEEAALGAEEKLATGREPERASSTGSPWLWLALATVVGALLWVVAKMLPSSTDGRGAA